MPSHNLFVGRERELAELRVGLDEAVSGRGGLFLISGEQGIGKSRLAEEFSREAAQRGMHVLSANAGRAAGRLPTGR
jgi:predicted ATPase